jgi:hypothetical protein
MQHRKGAVTPLAGIARRVSRHQKSSGRLEMMLAPTVMRRRWAPCAHATVGVLFAAIAALTSGCSEDPATVSNPESQKSTQVAAHDISWLTIDNDLSPAQWLASRNEQTLRPLSDPQVQSVKKLLDDAHRLYRESQRMIANRTVQIEVMLTAAGHKDSAIQVLQDLAGVPGEVGQTEGFGAIGQHYVNLRSEGLDREQALEKLKTLYGKRAP